VLPSNPPEILTAIRIAFRPGWSTLVATERIAATCGVGHFVRSASRFLAIDFVFVGIGMIAICAFAFSFAMRLVKRWLAPWKGQAQSSARRSLLRQRMLSEVAEGHLPDANLSRFSDKYSFIDSGYCLRIK
jgi:hypothetical protein